MQVCDLIAILDKYPPDMTVNIETMGWDGLSSGAKDIFNVEVNVVVKTLDEALNSTEQEIVVIKSYKITNIIK